VVPARPLHAPFVIRKPYPPPSPTLPVPIVPEASAPAAQPRRPLLPELSWRPKLRWFAAEIVVVVAGVLIALAINAWWSARQRAQDERRLIAALESEFAGNHGRLAKVTAFHEALKATTQTLLALSANPPATLTPDSVDQLLANVTWWSSYTSLQSTVLDAAVQDGQLDLIQTDSLRWLLVAWRSEVASAATQSGQEFTHYSQVWLPLLSAEGDLGQLSNRATFIPGSELPYQGGSVPLPAVPTNHRPLLGSRALRNALVEKLWIENDVLYEYARLQPLLRRVTAALERENAA
jgi:hypothetical protein